MLTLELADDDLRRITFSAAEHGETIGALQTLRAPAETDFHRQWQKRTRASMPTSVTRVLRLVPATGEVPDVLTPEHLTRRSTPRVVAAMVNASGETTELWSAVGPALVDFHRAAIDPVRHHMRQLLVAELAACAATLQRSGLDAALSRLGDHVEWKPPHLMVDGLRHETVHNQGRGLRLVPSVFWRRPGVVLTGYQVPTLVYPISSSDIARSLGGAASDPAALLGGTRSDILRALHRPMTTSEVAAAVGTSLANASTHLSVLRQNGLVGSQRTGRAVEHVALPLGRRLLTPFG